MFIVVLMGSPASKGAMGTYMAAPRQEAGQAGSGLTAIIVSKQVQILVLDGAPGTPQSLDHDTIA